MADKFYYRVKLHIKFTHDDGRTLTTGITDNDVCVVNVDKKDPSLVEKIVFEECEKHPSDSFIDFPTKSDFPDDWYEHINKEELVIDEIEYLGQNLPD